MEFVDEWLEPNPTKAEKVAEPGELLEETWFFGNLLDSKYTSKKIMLRSYSDPCTSSSAPSNSNHKSYEETYEAIKKHTQEGGFTRSGLMRAPSLPASMEGEEGSKGNNFCKKGHRRKQTNKGKQCVVGESLVRAPSMPTCLAMEEEQEEEDEESDFSMGKLIRQASLSRSDTLPPRRSSKGTVEYATTVPKHRLPRNPQRNTIKKTMSFNDVHQRSSLTTRKSLTDLESEELQGFKDLGFNFDKESIHQDVMNIIPGLQDKKRLEEDEQERRTRRPYLSEAWQAQNYTTPPIIPKWTANKSTQDIKAQIRFWARAVASNVRQEC